MTIALFSDIHANLPALEACLADIDRRQPDAVFCLGDLVGYNIWPNEVVREVRRRGIPTIAGNYDYGIGRSSDECGCAYKTADEKANGAISIGFTNTIMEAAERRYLRELPRHLRLEFEMADGDWLQLMLVHGSPRRINEYLFEDREEKSLLRILEGANADILCFGHTHKTLSPGVVRRNPGGSPFPPCHQHRFGRQTQGRRSAGLLCAVAFRRNQQPSTARKPAG